jgi:TolB protein
MNLDGAKLEQLTHNTTDDMAPAISPDGKRIAFMSTQEGNPEIYVMNIDGTNQQRLTNTPAYDSHPDWSPDGTKIAFISERDGNREIYVMNADGTNVQRLTEDPADDLRPDWSPDGDQILFNSMRNGNYDIFVMDVDGSNLRQLTDNPKWEMFPQWSPNGTRIAYTLHTPRQRDQEIYVMNADGSDERQLTDNAAASENPIWSPDGSQIAFQSDRDGNFEIYVIDVNGTEQDLGGLGRLTNDPAGDYWPSWGLPSSEIPNQLATRTPTEEPITIQTFDNIPTVASLHDIWTRPTDEMVMIYVPGGTFQMGSGTSDSDANDDEFPQHSVTLDGFWIDRTEVTNAQYSLCVADRACQAGPYADDTNFNGDDYPVVGVSWEDAANYCSWAGARLPTEAEWEYTARGTQGYIYPWGDDFDCTHGNFDGEGCDGYVWTAPAGSFPVGASWCGSLDMAGNVWEWVADWDGDYTSEAQKNPTGPTTGNRKILRGGSFNFGSSYARTTDRSRHYPDGREGYGGYVGFRCVIPAPADAEPTALSDGADLRITIIYDNYLQDDRLTAEWGFAALVEYADHILLFDTGGSDTLMNNMHLLSIDPMTIEVVVLSHEHMDHIGGLLPFLAEVNQPTVYLLASFPADFKNSVAFLTEVVEVTHAMKIYPDIYTTGEVIGGVKEQALAIRTDEGTVIITGCAHPGIVGMVRQGRSILQPEDSVALAPVALVVGGFHLAHENSNQIERLIADLQALDVERVIPTHCSGDIAIALFAEEFDDGYIPGGAGQIITLP